MVEGREFRKVRGVVTSAARFHFALRPFELVLVNVGMAVHAKLFFRIGKLINLFPVHLMAFKTFHLGVIAGEGKTRAVVEVFAAFSADARPGENVPAFSRMAVGAFCALKLFMKGRRVWILVTGLARLRLERPEMIGSRSIGFGRGLERDVALKALILEMLSHKREAGVLVVIEAKKRLPGCFVMAGLAVGELTELGIGLLGKAMIVGVAA